MAHRNRQIPARPMRPRQVKPGQVQSEQVRSGQVYTGQVQPGQSPLDQKKKRLQYGQHWLRLALKILGILIVVIVLFNFIFGFVRIEGHGMRPAVKAGDLVIFYRLDKTYLPDDLCVVKREGKLEVLRVLARSGDKVDISEQGVIVNGSRIAEPDIPDKTCQFEEGVAFPLTLAEGEIFVLGDNRPKATDSRIFGPIQEKDTLGTVMTVIRRRDF